MRLRMRLLEKERKNMGREPKEYKILLPEELAARQAIERKTVRLNMPLETDVHEGSADKLERCKATLLSQKSLNSGSNQ